MEASTSKDFPQPGCSKAEPGEIKLEFQPRKVQTEKKDTATLSRRELFETLLPELGTILLKDATKKVVNMLEKKYNKKFTLFESQVEKTVHTFLLVAKYKYILQHNYELEPFYKRHEKWLKDYEDFMFDPTVKPADDTEYEPSEKVKKVDDQKSS